MSAFLLSNAHIDILVCGAAQYGLERDPGKLRVLGQLWWTQNNRSVNHRYAERRRHPRYELHTTEAPLHPVAVLVALCCYTYQSCERPDWEQTEAYRYAGMLEKTILDRHPELAVEKNGPRGPEPAYRSHPVYKLAKTWGADDVEQAAAHRFEHAVARGGA